MNTLPIYELKISSNVDDDSEVNFVALVDKPAIEKNFMAFKFVEPSKGERKDDFLPRCISYVINEGKDNEQAVAICNSMWEQHFAETSYSDIPKKLIASLDAQFQGSEVETIFEQLFGDKQAILFGEGFGGKIQNGSHYSECEDFILFDVYFPESDVYAKREFAFDVAYALNIKIVPIVFSLRD